MWSVPVWGLLPTGLKEVLKGVGDFQTLVGKFVKVLCHSSEL